MSLSPPETIAMNGYKAELDEEIARAIANGDTSEQIVRRLFYFRRSPISKIHDDPVFKIFDSVALKFDVPFKSIYVSGSAQTGHSLYKNTDFTESASDLDLAIVDNILFAKYSEKAFEITKGYRDLTKFPRSRKISDVPGFFQKNLARGWFRPDLMPYCDERSDWFSYFQTLTKQFNASFNDINCGVYMSPVFFEQSLVQNLNAYMPKES